MTVSKDPPPQISPQTYVTRRRLWNDDTTQIAAMSTPTTTRSSRAWPGTGLPGGAEQEPLADALELLTAYLGLAAERRQDSVEAHVALGGQPLLWTLRPSSSMRLVSVSAGRSPTT
jgi:hypothetical protein